jgi:phosphopantetheine--protein transferase-like protein
MPADTKTSATLDSGIGIDIEYCDHLPAVADPWTETFYSDNFTPAEIAYCQRRSDPRESFCGIWCAKEAAIKSCQDFANRHPKELEIQWDSQGQPSLAVVSGGKPEVKSNCRISISHSNGLAAAVCVAGWGKVGSQPIEPVPTVANATSRPERRTLSWLALGLGILNLLLCLLLLLKK